MKPFNEDFSFDKYAKILKVPTPKSLVGKEVSASLKWDGDTCYLLLETPVCVSDEKHYSLLALALLISVAQKQRMELLFLKKVALIQIATILQAYFLKWAVIRHPIKCKAHTRMNLAIFTLCLWPLCPM